MAAIWITYAWDDNKDGDVDFVAQELQHAGLTVKLDRWNIAVGKRLWPQIEHFIMRPEENDAWLFVATNASLQSEPCKEESFYALQRALDTRGAEYPVIALFLGDVDEALIPAGIKTRLFVTVTDPDWKERIAAAAEGRTPRVALVNVNPYLLKIHQTGTDGRYSIEVRPRAGVWAPFFAAIPLNEKEDVAPSIMIGPRDVPTGSGMLVNTSQGPSKDGAWWMMTAGNQANPTTSYYIWCKRLPSKLVFGVNGGKPQYTVAVSGV